jgi:hypothetical protein
MLPMAHVPHRAARIGAIIARRLDLFPGWPDQLTPVSEYM